MSENIYNMMFKGEGGQKIMRTVMADSPEDALAIAGEDLENIPIEVEFEVPLSITKED